MGKDNQKYVYVTIALTRGSKAERWFTQDAEEHHMVEHPGKLGALRLTEYYELKEELKTLGMIAPSLLTLLRSVGAAPQPVNTSSSPALGPSSPTERSEPEFTEPPDMIRMETGQAEANAEEAGEYWNPL